MSAHAPPRKGWCPGALRADASGDGLIVRAAACRRRLALDHVARDRRAARRFGNGAIELSARGNLQMRGVAQTTLAGAARAGSAGSACSTPTPRPSACATSSRARSPASIPTPSSTSRPIVAALEARLRADPRAAARCRRKFGFVDRRRRRLPLGDVDGGRAVRGASTAPRTALARCERPGRRRDRWPLCAPAEAAAAAVALARRSCAAAPDATPPRRMRALVARRGAAAVFAAARARAARRAPAARRSPSPPLSRRRSDSAAAFVVGAAAPFGRHRAPPTCARSPPRGATPAPTGVRLTPWRALLVTGLDRGRRRRLAALARGRPASSSIRADPRLARRRLPRRAGLRPCRAPVTARRRSRWRRAAAGRARRSCPRQRLRQGLRPCPRRRR